MKLSCTSALHNKAEPDPEGTWKLHEKVDQMTLTSNTLFSLSLSCISPVAGHANHIIDAQLIFTAERQGSLMCCILWDHEELDMTEQQKGLPWLSTG